MNVILIGMPGCGKSTIGVLLAKALQLDFTDCDLVIQKRAKMGLQEIIDTKGIDEFLKIEEKVLCQSRKACLVEVQNRGVPLRKRHRQPPLERGGSTRLSAEREHYSKMHLMTARA